MFYNPKVLAGVLSVLIALIMSLLFSLFEDIALKTFLGIFLLGSAFVFFLLNLVLDRLFFRKARGLHDRVLEATGDARRVRDGNDISHPDPFAEIAEDLEWFVANQQREIDRLKKLEAFRKDFIADVSHELKTPIFAAQGFVHTLLDGAVKEKAVRKKFLKKAAKSLDGLDMLVQDLLTLSQIETGQIKMRFQEIDLFALTTDVFDQLRSKSNKKDMTLRIEGPVRKVLVYADWQRITQVMTNLISNAIKHSPVESEIIVSFSIRKKSVVTRVRDFGEGVPEQDLRRIFERFYRVDKSRSREKGGTGLGLAIVKHILEGHSSFPEVESTPGKGSTFSFKLPRNKHENTEDGEHQESATG